MRGRLVALAGLLALGLAPVAAQAPALGVLAGITSSNITIDGEVISVSLDSRTAITGGVSVQFPLGSMLALEVDALYTEKGTKISDGGDSAELKLSYIDVPVLLRYTLGTAEAKPFILAGGSLGLKLDCKVGATSGSVSANADCTAINENDQKGLDLGVTFGGGVAFNRLSLQARYTTGLGDIFDDNDDTVTSKNKALFLLAGFAF
jgi:hypothetical protein